MRTCRRRTLTQVSFARAEIQIPAARTIFLKKHCAHSAGHSQVHLYDNAGQSEAQSRYGKLMDAFRQRFGGGPEVFARAPGQSILLRGAAGTASCRKPFHRCDAPLRTGRVNLIGEHIDYEGYGVLPMAIKQVGGNPVSRSETYPTLGRYVCATAPKASNSTTSALRNFMYVWRSRAGHGCGGSAGRRQTRRHQHAP